VERYIHVGCIIDVNKRSPRNKKRLPVIFSRTVLLTQGEKDEEEEGKADAAAKNTEKLQ